MDIIEPKNATDAIALYRQTVEMAAENERLKAQPSCDACACRQASLAIIEPTADLQALGIIGPPRDVRRERALQLVEVLRSNFGYGNGGTRAEIRSVFMDVEGIREMPLAGRNKAWLRAWGRLEEAGRIARNPVSERFAYVEIPGADELAANPHAVTEFGWPVAQKYRARP